MNILLQHFQGQLGQLEKLSIANMKAYAETCNAEYKLLEGAVFNPNMRPQSQKLHMLSEEFDDYDVVVMLDIDCFTRRGMTKNIFTEEKGIGRHQQTQADLVKNLERVLPNLCSTKYPYWGGAVYRLERSVRQTLRKHINHFELLQFNRHLHDEGMMHRLAVLAKLPIDENTYMEGQSWDFNSFDRGIEDANIIHIRPKFKLEGPRCPKIDVYNYLASTGVI